MVTELVTWVAGPAVVAPSLAGVSNTMAAYVKTIVSSVVVVSALVTFPSDSTSLLPASGLPGLVNCTLAAAKAQLKAGREVVTRSGFPAVIVPATGPLPHGDAGAGVSAKARPGPRVSVRVRP